MDDTSDSANIIDVISDTVQLEILAWCPPPENFIKINVDAAILLGKSAAAAIARDHNGNIVAVSTAIYNQTFPQVAEAYGFLLAVELGHKLHLQSISVEGDCQTVVKVLNGEAGHTPWRILGTIECITFLADQFSSISYNFVKRRANSAAHNLASYAVKHNVQNCWTSAQIPSFILDSLSTDAVLI